MNSQYVLNMKAADQDKYDDDCDDDSNDDNEGDIDYDRCADL